MEQIFALDNIRLIVGLGNIGKDFDRTRHNAGFMFVEALGENWQPGLMWSVFKELEMEVAVCKPSADKAFILGKPQTMMNASGRGVVKLMNYYKFTPDQILVVHDDLDMPLGKVSMQFGRGPKGHNGLASIDGFLSTKDYWRLRIGIDAREVKGNKGVPGERYALERFKTAEQKVIDEQISLAIAEHFAIA